MPLAGSPLSDTHRLVVNGRTVENDMAMGAKCPNMMVDIHQVSTHHWNKNNEKMSYHTKIIQNVFTYNNKKTNSN